MWQMYEKNQRFSMFTKALSFILSRNIPIFFTKLIYYFLLPVILYTNLMVETKIFL
jgi:hypothetical protein